MAAVIGAIIALIGGFVQSRRHKDRLAVDIHMVWWMVWVVGIASVVGAGYHIFDGANTAELIGYTRGDGGFQWENAMGDLAIGVVGILAYWFRGHFWLCTIVVLTIQYVGGRPATSTTGWLRTTPSPTTSAFRCGPTSCCPSSCGRYTFCRGAQMVMPCRKPLCQKVSVLTCGCS